MNVFFVSMGVMSINFLSILFHDCMYMYGVVNFKSHCVGGFEI